MNPQTKFITLEGGEGSGKSTNIEYICSLLEQYGVDYVLTREPGGTEIAEKIRALLLDHHDESLAPMAELMLIFAARAQHIEKVIKPALANGQWVVCDRFTDATYAYQGVGRDLGVERIEQLEQLVQGSLRPDKVILLDLDVKLGFERVVQRGEKDRFEVEELAFFERVREGYHQRASQNKASYAIVDASQTLDKVQQDLSKIIQGLLDGDISRGEAG